MSFIDARKLPDGHRIEADLCIIGSGAAGLAIATEFRNSPLRVALLESGGMYADPTIQELCDGEIAGQQDWPLNQTRLRYFGGTTNHWTAHVRPLDPIDFEPRAWVPHSGWPFRLPALEPFYDRAQRFLDLPKRPFDPRAWHRAESAPWRFDGDRVATKVIQIVPMHKRKLGVLLEEEIAKAPGIETYLHATVLEIEPDEGQQRVRRLRIAAGGKRLTAHARSYVLATGGIENARLLLLSSSVSEAGVGNQHGLVGRFFANHPTIKLAGEFHPSAPGVRANFYRLRRLPSGPGLIKAALVLSPELQRSAELLNCRVEMRNWIDVFTAHWEQEGPRSLRLLWGELTDGRLPDDLDDHLVNVVTDMDHIAAAAYYKLRYDPDYPRSHLILGAFPEPAPNPESRVRLGEEVDRLGQRKVVLDWRLTEFDAQSAQRTVEILSREVGASGLGRIRDRVPEDGFASIDIRGSFHHMGTTRMHEDPKQGVVDAQCRVHGISNLFVAGSSVFPTYGTANPTLTILALAFRLSERLKETLG